MISEKYFNYLFLVVMIAEALSLDRWLKPHEAVPERILYQSNTTHDK